MQNDVRPSRRHPYEADSLGEHRDTRYGSENESGDTGGFDSPRPADFQPSPLFQPGQQRLNQFERSSASASDEEVGRSARSQGGPRARRPHSLPKGYKRSDERIRDDICETLSRSGTDVSDVSVEVSEGKVILEGTVIDRYAKHEIEDHAAECLGVLEVDNRIRVRR
ncbi:BON domain-containing protein [Parapusillimonas sp. SGNA-6]|jgi:hypothetical protein|nr:BON domain-containing protein [Parapusillimonas sp. SGNA-6]